MSDLGGRRISVVGGVGFLGHHLCVALSEAGAAVQAVDCLLVNNLLSVAPAWRELEYRDLYLAFLHERIELLRRHDVLLTVCDARDYHMLSRVLAEFRPDAIVHLAAVAHAAVSNKDPYSTWDHSLRTLENALDYARGVNLGHFVYQSSSMVYGHFDGEAEETHVLEPIDVYGAMKVAAETLCRPYNQVFGLPMTVVRPSALYGPRCISGRVVQRFIEAALYGRPISIRGDGRERLDFTYVDDWVRGLLLVLSKQEAKNETFNISAGGARTLAQLAQCVSFHFPGLQVRYEERDALMPQRDTLCINKARELLGYEPKHFLAAGVKKYVDWYRDRPEFHGRTG